MTRIATFFQLITITMVLLAATSLFAQQQENETPSKKEVKTNTSATLTPQQILEKTDYLNSGYDDQIMDNTMTIVDVDGSKKSYNMWVKQKGAETRFVRFTSGEIKNMSMLVEPGNKVHVYLPGFKKVRKVAAHAMNQSFAGSDFSNEDISSASWGKNYIPAIEREDDTAWYLKCTPKPDVDVNYAWVVVKVDKKNFHQLGVDYFNDKGERVKYQTCEQLTTFPGGAVRNKIVTMGDPRTGHKTILTVNDLKVNQGLSDSIFSVRQLRWGR